MARNEFWSGVPAALARRNAYHCSFPSCTNVTIGPSEESSIAVSSTGMACHIWAASGGPGARRVNRDIAADDLKSDENGIWMCYTHGKLIDTDEITYTAEMLKNWRELAVRRAGIGQRTGVYPPNGFSELAQVPLAREQVTITARGVENKVVGEAIRNCAVALIWGDDFAHAARDLLIELIRNAFSHGSATAVTIEIEESRIVINDDGNAYDQLSLPRNPNGRGGAHAVRALLEKFPSTAILAYKRKPGRNEITLGRIQGAEDVGKITACSVIYTRRSKSLSKTKLGLESCSVIYVTLPEFWSLSDAYQCDLIAECGIDPTKQIVVVLPEASEDVAAIMRKRYPKYRIIRVSR